MTDAAPAPGPTTAPALDLAAQLRTKRYVGLLVLAALLGAPVSLASWGFLQLLNILQTAVYTRLPPALGFAGAPWWWPLLILGVAGLVVAFAVAKLPGGGGHVPALGFQVAGSGPIALPGVLLAAIAGIGLGIVLGPEAPLIALGGGLGGLAVYLIRKDAPPLVATVVAAAGSFAAISTIFGSPIIAAFFLMEAIGLGGTALTMVLLPGLIASGTGDLVFIGFGRWTGISPPTLSYPTLPHYVHPSGGSFAWSVAFGIAGGLLGWGIKWLGRRTYAITPRRLFVYTPAAGLAVAGLCIAFAELTGKDVSNALSSGESTLGPLVAHAHDWPVAALLALIILKSLAYGISLGSFRGGPTFPALFIGAAAGLMVAPLPGLGVTPAVSICMAAMCVAMLNLPLSSVVLVLLLTLTAGMGAAPLIIVTTVVAYVTTAWLPSPGPIEPAPTAPAAPPAPAPVPAT